MLSSTVIPIKKEDGILFLDVNDIVSISKPKLETNSGTKVVVISIVTKLSFATSTASVTTNKQKLTYTASKYGCTEQALLVEVEKIYDDLLVTILGNKEKIETLKGTIKTLDLKK